MHKNKLIKYLAGKYRRPQHHYQEAINEIFAGMQHHLAEGKEVTLIGFGTFYSKMHKAGKAFNIKARKPMEYKAYRFVGFRPGILLKRAVRREPSYGKTRRKRKK